MYDVGDRARLTFSVTDVSGTPTNGTVVLTVTKPDQSTATPTTSNQQTGSYTADVDLDQAGRWTYRWTATGAVTAAQTDVLDVAASTPTGIVSLADVKDHLNITTTTHDEELRRYINAATDFIEGKIGPVVRRSITQTVYPEAGGRLYLSGPIISVSSITSAYGYSATYDVAQTYLDGDGGVIIPPYASTFTYPVTVTYVAGRVIVPALIRQAALDYVRWMWESQRGPSNPVDLVQGGEFEVATPATVPYRVTQALEPYMSAGIA